MNTKLLKQKILDLAIRGKLVPQDPNDEPASELLKRIRAEKEKLIAEGKIKRSKKTGDKPHYENVPFEVPNSWEWVTLGDISNYGQTKHTDVLKILEEDWVLELEDVEKDSGRLIQTLSRKDRKISGVRCEIECGQILYSKLRTYLNKVLIAPKKGFCTTEIIPFYCFGKISHYYITSVLRSQYFIDYTTLCCYGCKMPRLSTDDARKGMIPLPPIAEQKRIVLTIKHLFLLIDSIDASKNDLQEAVDRCKTKVLDLAIHGKLVSQDPNDEPAVELLKRINPNVPICDTSHYGNLPKSWCVVKLGDIGKWQAGGTPNRGVKEYYGGNIPWLKTGDLNDGFINKIPECITQAGLDNSSAKLNPKDSVLIAMYGATIGKIGILTFPAATNQACCACVDYPLLEKIYLFYFLLSHRDAFIMQGGGGAQPNISKEIILNTEIPLPPINEQKRIAEMITEVFSFLDKISADL